ncbi:MAG: nucleotide-binding protein [Prevotella sp.]|nr:nucleotide-binding protein [Prevotella sp.]
MSGYEKLKKLIGDTDELIKKDITSSDPEFAAWEVKVKRFVSNKFGSESIEMREFNNTLFFSGSRAPYETKEMLHKKAVDFCRDGLKTTKAVLETYLDELEEEKIEQQSEPQAPIDLSKVFIVHGHDGELKESVARIIEKQNIEAIILSEQANTGLTIIEKFEKNSNVGCAICLFTADDIGRAKSENENKPRARQNVVFETGYFIGKLGREHIIILADSGIEIPSDLAGVVYTNTQDWQIDLLKELKSMRYNVDFNKLL